MPFHGHAIARYAAELERDVCAAGSRVARFRLPANYRRELERLTGQDRKLLGYPVVAPAAELAELRQRIAGLESPALKSPGWRSLESERAELRVLRRRLAELEDRG